ncbi:LOW QUALITY PROTEIN: hypothetical protein V1477_017790 [Vespula maculifrons]|uniref:Uncharacterized protein n=1 Tax=Vespula maculifrons TaxID=7453 RepID=A0ABD2B0G6_VESMC
MWACWQRRSHCNDPGLVFLGAIVSEKKIVKKNFFPLFPLNHYNSAPICQILIKKIWACRARSALPSGPVSAFVSAIVSEKKIVTEKYFFPLFPLYRYNSDLDKRIWARRARRALSNDPAPVFLGATLSEKKIVKENFFFRLFRLIHNNSAPIDLDKKIWACIARRSLSYDPGRAFVGSIVSEKKIVTEKFFFPLFPLNHYNSAPIGQILIQKIWACRPRRSLANDVSPVFLDAILSEKKIVKEKFFFPLSTLNRYYSVPIGQILI